MAQITVQRKTRSLKLKCRLRWLATRIAFFRQSFFLLVLLLFYSLPPTFATHYERQRRQMNDAEQTIRLFSSQLLRVYLD
jgi:hypothetical protein